MISLALSPQRLRELETPEPGLGDILSSIVCDVLGQAAPSERFTSVKQASWMFGSRTRWMQWSIKGVVDGWGIKLSQRDDGRMLRNRNRNRKTLPGHSVLAVQSTMYFLEVPP